MVESKTGDDSEPYYADFTKKDSSLPKPVVDLIYWKDAKMSGAALGAGIVLYVLTSFRGYTYLSLTSLLLLTHLLISLAMTLVARWQGKSTPQGKPLQVDPELAKKAVEHVNRAIVWYSELLRGEDVMTAGKVVGVLFVTWTLGSWFDGPTLLMLIYVSFFSLPLGYKKNRKVVDEKLAMVQAKLQEVADKINSKIPKATPAPAPAAATNKQD